MATKPNPAPDTTPTPPYAEDAPGTAPAAYLDTVRAEYSQYRALQTLSYQGVPCYAEGARVAASHPNVPQWLDAGVIAPVT